VPEQGDDDGKTEEDTFQAIRQAIDELAALIVYIVNNLNGNHIVITADHGFLFSKTAPGEPEKSKLEEKPEGTVTAKKRYLIGHKLPDNEAALHGTTAATAGLCPRAALSATERSTSRAARRQERRRSPCSPPSPATTC
jgi:hypothetical protein